MKRSQMIGTKNKDDSKDMKKRNETKRKKKRETKEIFHHSASDKFNL